MAEELGTATLEINVDLERLKVDLEKARQLIQKAGLSAGIGAGTGPGARAGGRVQGGARENVNALERAQNTRFRLSQRINALEEKGVNTERLRSQLGKATAAIAERQFGSFNKIATSLSRNITLAASRLRVERSITGEIAKQARVGGARESLRGRVGLSGSPADLAFLARQGGPASPVRGLPTLPGSPAAIKAEQQLAAARQRAAQAAERAKEAELRRLAQLGGARSPVGGSTTIVGSPAAIAAERRLTEARERAALAAKKAAESEGRRIGLLNTSPVKGGAAFPGSPNFFRAALPPLPKDYFEGLRQRSRRVEVIAEEQLSAARKRTAAATKQATNAEQRQRNEAIRSQLSNSLTSSVIGGAFPLLFGQGAGASLGGLAGGLLGSALGPGGGFAGSLFGTVIGQTADQFNQLAKALESPGEALPQLIEGANLSGFGVEKLAKTLQDLGQTAAAETLLLGDIESTINPTVLTSAAAAQDRYARNVADLQERLGAFLVGPATKFVDWLTELSERVLGLPEQGVQPSTRGALVGRGLGAATGIAGVGLSSLGVAASFINPAIGVPLAVGGIGLSALGSSQIAGAENQEEQVSIAKALEGVYDNINAIQARRIDLQRQILRLSEDEKGNADELRQLNKDAALAEIDVQKARASARYQALPGVPSKAEFQSLKKEYEALELQAEAIEAAFKKAVAASDPGNIVRDSIQRQIDSSTEGFKGLILSAAIASGAVSNSFANVQQSLELLEQGRTVLDVDSSAFIGASVDIAFVRDQLDQLDGRKAQVEVEVLSTGLDTGLLESSFRNFQRLTQELRTVAETARIGTPEFTNAVDRYKSANAELKIVSGILDGTFKDGADAIRQAGRQLQSTLEGGFELLRPNIQQDVLANARRDINFGFIDPSRVRTPQDVIRAAQLSRQINTDLQNLSDTTSAVGRINERLANSSDALNGVILRLVEKDWNVYVETGQFPRTPALG